MRNRRESEQQLDDGLMCANIVVERGSDTQEEEQSVAAVNRSIDIFTPCQLSVQHSGKSLQSEVRFSEEGQSKRWPSFDKK